MDDMLFADDGRTMLVAEGWPVMVHLILECNELDDDEIPSEVVGALVIATEDDDGRVVNAPLPFADATIGRGKTNTGRDRLPNGYTPEFRMDMN